MPSSGASAGAAGAADSGTVSASFHRPAPPSPSPPFPSEPLPVALASSQSGSLLWMPSFCASYTLASFMSSTSLPAA
eukprot:8133141-Pyramimonas_sp.AAC.2